MEHTIDKGNPEAPSKTRELKRVRGYVAPTETGGIRMVRSHEKLVEVDVKEEKSGNTPSPEEVKIKGAQTVNEAVSKISSLNKKAREANFSEDTDHISKATVGFYRGGVNTSSDPRLDQKDGLRKIFDDMNDSLNKVGFKNKFNLTSHQSFVKMTSERFIRNLAGKTSMVERKIKDVGLETKRMDPFTVQIKDEMGNDVYVSNNPLDLMTAEKIGNINEKNGNILTAIHQDQMNDFVFYTANKIDGGHKIASAIATYDPKTRKFYHYNDRIHENLKPVLKDTLKSKKTLHDSGRSLAEIEMWEVRAMITERLQTLQQEAENSVKGDNDTIEKLLKYGDGLFDKNAIMATYAKEINKSMSDMNKDFEDLVYKKSPKSLATGSPLHQKISIFKNAMNEIIGNIKDVLDDFSPEWKKVKSQLRG